MASASCLTRASMFESAFEFFRGGDQQLIALLDHSADVVGQAAIGE